MKKPIRFVSPALVQGILCVALIAEVGLLLVYADRRGIVPTHYHTDFSLAQFWASPSGAYPPGTYAVYALVRSILDQGVFFWNAVFLALTAGLLWWGARLIGKAGLVGLGLLTLNFYGLWLMLTSNDTVLENLFFIAGMLVLWEVLRRRERVPVWLGVLLLILPGMAGMMRVTSLITWFFVLGLAALITRRRWIVAGWVALVLVMLGFCGLNAGRWGEFGLTTTTAANLYLGNHPHYLRVHPYHDIETLSPMLNQARAEIRAGNPGVEGPGVNAVIKRRALQFIVQRPTDFLVRSAMKANWYFLGYYKIPLYTEAPLPVLASDGTLGPSKPDLKISLIYLPYGVVFLALFWFSLIHHLRKRRWDMLLFYVPFIVMGLVGMLIFPDTRYRQAAELVCVWPIAVYVQGLIEILAAKFAHPPL